MDGAQSQYTAPGEQVCALEYRKICYGWLPSKHIDKAQLSNVRQWPLMDRARDEEDGEDDIIEVKSSEVPSLEGEWDKEVVDGEVFYLPS